ncbi:MAG TPA: CocE/NonD family hydrolase [Gemmatimonadaceae bacterium]|nr:CocE/NonD family hydrolase [Gemmatimonadaceae bacterium]
MRRPLAAVALALLSAAPLLAQAPPGPDPMLAARIKELYTKREVRIRARDGVQLFTSIYVPRDTTRRYPVLMSRTPYSVSPYGADYKPTLGPSGNHKFVDDGYIFVYQDVRGRNFSEGVFRDMTPILEKHDKPTDVDEGTDAYDTIDWLVKNLPTNGKVGIYGTSYPGFYTTASCLSRHPALAACSPQAPMTDIWMGDDNFHGGAFLLAHNFGFYRGFGRTPRAQPGPDPRYPFSMLPDAYEFYLDLGPLGPGTRKILDSATAPLWQEILTHPAYDEFWKARNVRPHLHDVKAAVLTVGGFYDTEDIHGPWWVFGSIERQSPGADNHVIVGPWSHGGWSRGDDDVLGTLHWKYKTGPFFRDSVEYPFFAHYLAGAPDPKLPKVLVFRTGGDQWDGYDSWPPKASTPAALYLQANGKLAFTPPSGGASFDEYVSDPAKPVPLVERIENNGMPRDYITADQRFASRRTDVLTYQTDVLTSDVTLTGPVNPVLHVSTSGTDADFIVKLIDVFPDTASNWTGDQSGFTVGGYQQLVRGEPFRARYRRSFEKPSAMVPNAADSIKFEMPSIHHTFRRGHRIMVQVQSTWFPHIDRNPQRFVPNIFEAKPSDFQKATMRVYHTPEKATRLELRRLPDER